MANKGKKYQDSTKLVEKSKLYDANEDLSGWISIPALQIELPIAKGSDNDYYRNRDIYKKYTMYGVPFFDYRMTDLKNLHRNTVLYGHNMLDGSMFATLHRFSDQQFFNENRYMYVYTEINVWR